MAHQGPVRSLFDPSRRQGLRPLCHVPSESARTLPSTFWQPRRSRVPKCDLWTPLSLFGPGMAYRTDPARSTS
ncbi:hypothetical protein Taro_015323 [Colocasia esculenta]|uniref:Uncharacterized protein n=1 Tax=Colocasia esculenta TaxID=4460 RepID=A0A843UHF4_COLES|nr:hypothetical protein [Colocasia esculenta]